MFKKFFGVDCFELLCLIACSSLCILMLGLPVLQFFNLRAIAQIETKNQPVVTQEMITMEQSLSSINNKIISGRLKCIKIVYLIKSNTSLSDAQKLSLRKKLKPVFLSLSIGMADIASSELAAFTVDSLLTSSIKTSIADIIDE